MGLFQLGNFKLHSGQESCWKIECDALSDSDWAALAFMLAERLPKFTQVEGVPRGGLKLADALIQYSYPYCRGPVLIVDDVLTTGNSMEELRKQYNGYACIGAVIFARQRCPEWITPLFQMYGGSREYKLLG